MKAVRIGTTLLFLFVLAVYRVYAADVSINEFIIDRTPQLIELTNSSTSSADLSGWYLDDGGGTSFFTIPTGTVLYTNSCAVFEGDFNLNKSSADTVRLFNNTAPPTAANAMLVDSYSYKQSPGTGLSYSRLPDSGPDWSTQSSTPGQYNQNGLSCLITPTPLPTTTPVPTETVAPTATESATPMPTATPRPDYRNVFLNEVYPYPPSGAKEWVELYNDNGFEVILTDWYIDDVENTGGTPRRFSATVPAHGYGVIEISGSLFNNGADSVRLLNQDKVQIDGFEYGKSRQDMSLGRISLSSDTVCLEEPSRGSVNNPCFETTPTPQPPSAPPLQPTAHPTSAAVPATDNSRSTASTIISEPTVLGETTIEPPDDSNVPTVPVRKLASVSFSYSILTIVSLLIKIKNGLTA